jgi:methionyl-tRNA formyltransferase
VVSRPSLRVVFFGTPAFAVPTLERLTASSHRVVGIVTQPDRPRGRGQKVVAGAVKAFAEAHALPLLQPETLARDVVDAPLAALGADLGVVAAYGKILPEWLLHQPRLGMINVHGSLLPSYRGAAPVHRAIMDGQYETGVTIMRVVKALDAGAMLATIHRRIDPDETSVELERELAVLGAQLLVDTVDRMAAGPVHEEPQDDARATYAPKITRDDAPVDWARPARAIHDQIRGLHPWPHAVTTLDGRRLILLRSRLPDPSPPAGDVPGTVRAAGKEGVAVTCGDGHLVILTELQAEGGRPLAARDFLAGRPITPGQRLGAA